MEPIASITTEQLLDDRAASEMDIQMCDIALLHQIEYYGDGSSVAKRRKINEKIIGIIDAELERRNSP